MKKRVIIAVVLLVFVKCAMAQSPYPPSEVITSVSWDFDTHVSLAPGSDNFPVTWADDDNLYTSWGDGGGFGGTNSDGRVSLGFARIDGSPENFIGHNVWGGKNPDNPATFIGKAKGILSIDGVLYAFIRIQPDDDRAQIIWSTDYGNTWNRGFEFTESSTDNAFVQPTFIQFGKDYQDARDGYVYIYSGQHKFGTKNDVFMARVPKNKIRDRSEYDFFFGLDSNDNPLWTSDYFKKKPVFTDSNGVGHVPAVHYFSGINRYILTNDWNIGSAWGMFDAPEPWGPWSTVVYYDIDDWFQTDGDGLFSFYFPAKWRTNDDKDFWMIFSGTGIFDSFNLIKGSLSVVASEMCDDGDCDAGECTSCPQDCEISDCDNDDECLTGYGDGDENCGNSPADCDCGSDLCCSNQCTSVCLSNSDCGLDTACMTNICSEPGTCAASCLEIFIESCIDGDGCCPPGCSDDDCGFISNIIVTSGKPYEVIDELQTGELIYIDRTYTITNIPTGLVGKTFIRTANDDKNSTGSLRFDVNQDVIVYVAYDDRVIPKSGWLASFIDTNDDIITTDTNLDVYAKNFSAGTIVLGGNEGGEISSMYSVIVGQVSTCSPADIDPVDNVVDIGELISFMEKWKSGAEAMDDLVDAIKFWKSGCS